MIVDTEQGYGSPQGKYFIYVRDKTGLYFVGGYNLAQKERLVKKFSRIYGKKNVIVSLSPLLTKSWSRLPQSGYLSTLSAVKSITNYEKNIGSKMMRLKI